MSTSKSDKFPKLERSNSDVLEQSHDASFARDQFAKISHRRRESMPVPVGGLLPWKRANNAVTLPLLFPKVKRKRSLLDDFRRNSLDINKRNFAAVINRRLSYDSAVRESSDVTHMPKPVERRLTRLRAFILQKQLRMRFRRAVRLAVFCARNFKQHCLRWARKTASVVVSLWCGTLLSTSYLVLYILLLCIIYISFVIHFFLLCLFYLYNSTEVCSL